MSSGCKLIENFAVAARLLSELLQNPRFEKDLSRAVEILVKVFRSGGQVYACGNGGSMCDAMHFAEELTGQFKKARPPLPALAFSDVSALSCIANDFGYEEIFARMVQAYGRSGHVLLAISTSGNSPNIVRAAKKAGELGLFVIGLSGETGGQLKELCEPCFLVPSNSSDRIQEVHIKILHTLIEGVERELFPQNYL
jgi:D-sedoheptulose 7-phosphate isomerase